MNWKQRFLAKSVPDPNSECILWTGFVTVKGYGRIWAPITPSNQAYAHRAAFVLFRDKDLSENLDVHHTCKTRCCVNPYHLEAIPRLEHCKISSDDFWDDYFSYVDGLGIDF